MSDTYNLRSPQKVITNIEIDNLLVTLREKVGIIFNEDNLDAYNMHLEELTELGLVAIGRRINLLFAFISNINHATGDTVETNIIGMPSIVILKEYKFSMTNELAMLCSLMISKESNQVVAIDTQDKFDLFHEILDSVDEIIWDKKLNDSDASILLLNMLTKNLFKIDNEHN
jgi:hypothetical protein